MVASAIIIRFRRPSRRLRALSSRTLCRPVPYGYRKSLRNSAALPIAQQLWSAEIYLRCPIAPGFYRCGSPTCLELMCDLKAELKFRTPKALRAAGMLSHLHGCVCNYNPLPTPLAAAPRFEPAAQRRFASLSSRALRRVGCIAVGIRRPYISLASGLRRRSPATSDQRSAAGPRPASCRWRRRCAALLFLFSY